MYASTNPKSKAELKRQLAIGKPVPAYQPGPFGPNVSDGFHSCEGPHYPKPHRWYARVEVRNGLIVKVLA